LTTGWRIAQRYWNTLFSGFSTYWALRAASSRATEGLPRIVFFNFLQDFEPVLYHHLCGALGEVIKLFSADPEEGLPTELRDTLQPGLFSAKELDALGLLLI
jgi:hypothetical protein